MRVLATIFLLLTTLTAGAQSSLDAWSKKFEAYQSVWPRTKLQLTFNQTTYAPGDTAWFKAWLLKEDATPVPDKQQIELNLLGAHDAPYLRAMFLVENGTGHCQLILPDTLSPGIYLVTAHSNWMMNFDPALIFRQTLTVVKDNDVSKESTPHIDLAVEGGHLVRDVPNRVALSTQQPDLSWQLIASDGKEIARGMTDRNGTVSIAFTPARGTTYRVQLQGNTSAIPLPEVENDGCSLRVVSFDPLEITVASPPGSALLNKTLAIIVTAKAKVRYSTTFVMGNGNAPQLGLPKEQLPEGIATISLLDPEGKLLASRDLYASTTDSVQVKIHFPRQLTTREKGSFVVSLSDRQGTSLPGEFSARVLNTRLFPNEQPVSFADALNIAVETKGHFAPDRNTAEWQTSLDNYLIAVTDPLPWNEILADEIRQPAIPFTGVRQRTGTVYFADTHEPVPDYTQIMFYLQHDTWHYQTFTLGGGKFRITLPYVYGKEEFLYLAEERYGADRQFARELQNFVVEWDEDHVPLPHAPRSNESVQPSRYGDFVTKNRLIQESFGFYDVAGSTGPVDALPEPGTLEDELMGADLTVNVQDYVTFPTMEDLVREVIPAMFYRKSGKKAILRIYLSEKMMAATTGDPVYVIDGIATKNTAFFMSLKPADVLTIKLVKDQKKLERFGLMGKNGIVIIETKQGNTREPVDASKLVEGLIKPLPFPARIHTVGDDVHNPDFRSTIHWVPSVKTFANGKAEVSFFTSDDVGKMTLIIEGITADGRPFSAKQEIDVVAAPAGN